MKTLHRALAALFTLAAFATTAHAIVIGTSVTLDLSGQTFADKQSVTVQNTVDALQPSARYDYSIDATVAGSGLLAVVVPAGTHLGDFLEMIKPGASSYLTGSALNPSGKLPFTAVLNRTIAGHLTVAGHALAASLVLTAGIDKDGHAGFSVKNVSITSPIALGGITFENGSTMTIGYKLIGDDGSYAGLIHGATFDPATEGIAFVTVTKAGKFTGSATIGGVKRAFTGTFDANGNAGPIVLIKPALASLSLSLIGNTVTGTITGAPAGTFSAVKDIYTKANPFSKPGTYNVLLPAVQLPLGKTAADLPQGDGYGTVKIGTDGTAAIALTLGDNTKVTAKSTVTTDFLGAGDTIPLYIPLSKNLGVLTGTIGVNTGGSTPSLATFLGSALHWVKPAVATDKLFPAGFDTAPNLTGELYTKPVAGVAVLPSALGFALSYGNLGANPFTQALTIDTANKITATAPNMHNVKVTIATATGLVTGSFTSGTPAKTYKFTGMLLPKNFGGIGGLFLGAPPAGTPEETGFFEILGP